MRIFCDAKLFSFTMNSENLSTMGKGFKILKPQRIAALGLCFNAIARSVKVDSPLRFLKIIAFKRPC